MVPTASCFQTVLLTEIGGLQMTCSTRRSRHAGSAGTIYLIVDGHDNYGRRKKRDTQRRLNEAQCRHRERTPYEFTGCLGIPQPMAHPRLTALSLSDLCAPVPVLPIATGSLATSLGGGL
jgi:hypothetical protein